MIYIIYIYRYTYIYIYVIYTHKSKVNKSCQDFDKCSFFEILAAKRIWTAFFVVAHLPGYQWSHQLEVGDHWSRPWESKAGY